MGRVKLALVVPHIFMHRDILPNVIFSPGRLAISLADALSANGIDVTLYTPGPVKTRVKNINADLSYFEKELEGRGDSYMDLLRKHPFTFVTLARQVQGELIAKAYENANRGLHDVVHVYTNEEELGYTFARFCKQPVLFTHHDPFNFLVKYKNYLPKYRHLNWISMSYAQRKGMPDDTNWVGNVYHGLDDPKIIPVESPSRGYFAYLGRIIEPKGVHLAIKASKKYNQQATTKLPLKLAGKHYSEATKDTYWREIIEPELGDDVEYVGFLSNPEEKRNFLANAKALIVPSLFEEPFGMVTIEALACGTPVIALDSGALPEVVSQRAGIIVPKSDDENAMIDGLAGAMSEIDKLDPRECRKLFEENFTIDKMADGHLEVYRSLIKQ